jgi:hypothetical protein
MSEYVSSYSGMEIDDAINKIKSLSMDPSGFVIPKSTVDNPVDLNILIIPKFYLIDYYINGAGTTDTRRPISLRVITLSSDVIEQSYLYNNRIYSRTYVGPTKVWSNWGVNDTYYTALSTLIATYPHIKNLDNFIFSDTDPIIANPDLSGYHYTWAKITNRTGNDTDGYSQDIEFIYVDENGHKYNSYSKTKWENIINIPSLLFYEDPESPTALEYDIDDIVL